MSLATFRIIFTSLLIALIAFTSISLYVDSENQQIRPKQAQTKMAVVSWVKWSCTVKVSPETTVYGEGWQSEEPLGALNQSCTSKQRDAKPCRSGATATACPAFESWCKYIYKTGSAAEEVTTAGSQETIDCPKIKLEKSGSSIDSKVSTAVSFSDGHDAWVYSPASLGDFSRFKANEIWKLEFSDSIPNQIIRLSKI